MFLFKVSVVVLKNCITSRRIVSCNEQIMGIDLATWRARIGLNYYHKCCPLQTRWRSSGGWVNQPGVVSWVVGEVMNDTPLVLKGCMTVVALSLILQYVVHSCSKLGRGGSGKVHCHWRGSTFRMGQTINSLCLLLRAIVVVIIYCNIQIKLHDHGALTRDACINLSMH